MNAAFFEPRPLYGIGTVARLTGLKPDTLRVWERRYGLGASHKSATGRRQYTQADLEHLQLVAALVSDGARIGEIASSERKTLEMLLRQRGAAQRGPLGPSKPRAVFIGSSLCDWLDKHQGCITNTDARLARVSLTDVTDDDLDVLGECDVMVVECPSLGGSNVARLRQLREAAVAARTIVCYQFGNEHWVKELEAEGVVTMPMPLDPARLAFEVARGGAEQIARAGEQNLGDLMAAKPRQFGERELSAARTLKSTLDCECPRHIADLIEALANFEEYSSSCSIDNWHAAAVHSCIYAYTGQARHLMEKAMQAVLEEREAEFQAAVNQQQQTGRRIDDAA